MDSVLSTFVMRAAIIQLVSEGFPLTRMGSGIYAASFVISDMALRALAVLSGQLDMTGQRGLPGRSTPRMRSTRDSTGSRTDHAMMTMYGERGPKWQSEFNGLLLKLADNLSLVMIEKRQQSGHRRCTDFRIMFAPTKYSDLLGRRSSFQCCRRACKSQILV